MKNTSCVKDRLDALGFNWSKGRIILRYKNDKPSVDDDYLDKKDDYFTFKELKLDDPMITEITISNDGWSSSGFHYYMIGYDDKKIYYIWEYDGNSGYTCMFLNPNDYISYKETRE